MLQSDIRDGSLRVKAQQVEVLRQIGIEGSLEELNGEELQNLASIEGRRLIETVAQRENLSKTEALTSSTTSV